MTSTSASRGLSRRAEPLGIAVWAAAAVQLGMLTVAALRNLHVLNPDGVAYLRVARYWAEGDLSLMVSGYWGPLLSWLMVPVLWVTDHPIAPARVATLVAAIVFFWGAVAALRGLGLPRRAVAAGAFVTAAATVFWSVRGITPDLLLGGFLALGAAGTVHPGWPTERRVQLGAGVSLAFAYYAKAVAFPLSIGLVLGMAAFVAIVRPAHWWQALRAAATTLGIFLAVSAPWLVVLSWTYGKPTFSESGGINHALVGPHAEGAGHPYRFTFHEPEAGRLTQWEDPTAFEYPSWSPLASAENLRHQLRLVSENYRSVLRQLMGFDLLGLAFVATVAAFLFHAPWLRRIHEERFRWALLPIVPMSLIYLPVFANKTRYFYGTFPFVLAGFLGLGLWAVSGSTPERWRPGGRAAVLAVAVALLLPPILPDLLRAFRGLPKPEVRAARTLGAALERAEVEARSLAGAGHAGLYTAFFADLRFHGDLVDRPWSVEDVRAGRERLVPAPADLLLAPRSPGLRRELERGLGYQSLDPLLFPGGAPPGLALELFRAPAGRTDGDPDESSLHSEKLD